MFSLLCRHVTCSTACSCMFCNEKHSQNITVLGIADRQIRKGPGSSPRSPAHPLAVVLRREDRGRQTLPAHQDQGYAGGNQQKDEDHVILALSLASESERPLDALLAMKLVC